MFKFIIALLIVFKVSTLNAQCQLEYKKIDSNIEQKYSKWLIEIQHLENNEIELKISVKLLRELKIEVQMSHKFSFEMVGCTLKDSTSAIFDGQTYSLFLFRKKYKEHQIKKGTSFEKSIILKKIKSAPIHKVIGLGVSQSIPLSVGLTKESCLCVFICSDYFNKIIEDPQRKTISVGQGISLSKINQKFASNKTTLVCVTSNSD